MKLDTEARRNLRPSNSGERSPGLLACPQYEDDPFSSRVGTARAKLHDAQASMLRQDRDSSARSHDATAEARKLQAIARLARLNLLEHRDAVSIGPGLGLSDFYEGSVAFPWPTPYDNFGLNFLAPGYVVMRNVERTDQIAVVVIVTLPAAAPE